MHLKGIVYKSTGSWYSVKDEEGNFWDARIRGKFKIDVEISSTNPIAVGDEVILEVEDEKVKTAVIIEVCARNNYMVRVSPHNKNQKHIIAANIDVALMIVTIDSPRTSTGFIDRFLITAEAYHIPAILEPASLPRFQRYRDETAAVSAPDAPWPSTLPHLVPGRLQSGMGLPSLGGGNPVPTAIGPIRLAEHGQRPAVLKSWALNRHGRG